MGAEESVITSEKGQDAGEPATNRILHKKWYGW